jgi:hypothetical protein
MENITQNPLGTPGIKKEKYIISIVVFILAIAVAYLAWYVNGRPQTPPTPPQASVLAPVAKEAVPAASPETQASLGGNIYAQAQNPIKDKIPETVAPVSNPIGGAYKNPFE